MISKILFVDDDKNLLDSYKRNFKDDFEIITAANGKEGLELLIENGPFAVIISDYKMPEMNGINFLSVVKDTASDTVRILLTGYADLDLVINSVNKGEIFRFLTKPCPIEDLKSAIMDGLHQYRLITAEKILLQETLKGSIKVLTEILSLTSPIAFNHATRVSHTAGKIAKGLKHKNIWKIEIAALLSQIGSITFSENIINKVYNGQELSPEEEKKFIEYPRIGHDLLIKIPRMNEIANIVFLQRKNFDGTGFPKNVDKSSIPIEARILKAAIDYDILTSSGKTEKEAYEIMVDKNTKYDSKVLDEIRNIALKSENTFFEVNIKELQINMILAEDLITKEGSVLLPKGQKISDVILHRIDAFKDRTDIKEPIKVSYKE